MKCMVVYGYFMSYIYIYIYIYIMHDKHGRELFCPHCSVWLASVIMMIGHYSAFTVCMC